MSVLPKDPKILLVDDNAHNLFALRKIIGCLDIGIIEAHSGREALEMVLVHDFFVVLMDVQMPEMNGFETARRMFENPLTSHLPVIFLTAMNCEENFVMKGYEAGAVDFLIKPLNGDVLLSKVNVFLKLYQKENELVQVNKKLDKFISVASHDLKAPLRHIGFYSKIVQDDHGEELSEEVKEYLGRIGKTNGRLFQLVNDLLNYARLKPEKIDREPVCLVHIVSEVIEDLSGIQEECQAEFVVGELPTINSNPFHMRQVFQNLLSNSLKYRDDNRPPVIEIQCHKEGEEDNMCHIAVQDNGMGFEEAHSQRVFEPFVRLVGSDDIEGSGMGLSTVYEIVQAHGGKVLGKGVPGEGAVFTVSLPLS